MLFVLVVEVEGKQTGARVFRDYAEAKECYVEAVRVCMDGPDDDGGTTPYLISNCWLYSADTSDEEAARQTAFANTAVLVAAFCEE
jgi:hypothetical protein